MGNTKHGDLDLDLSCNYDLFVIFYAYVKPLIEIGGGSDVVSVTCIGVRFSVMFHFMFAHYTFSSVWVAEWPPFGK